MQCECDHHKLGHNHSSFAGIDLDYIDVLCPSLQMFMHDHQSISEAKRHERIQQMVPPIQPGGDNVKTTSGIYTRIYNE